MATIKLIVEIEDVTLSKSLMEEGWLEKKPMPKIPDPAWDDPKDGSVAPKVDKFANTKLWAQDGMADYVVSVVNKGLKLKAKRESVAFTRNMVS